MYRLNDAGGVRVTGDGLFYGPVRLVGKSAATGRFAPRPMRSLKRRLRAEMLPSVGGLQTVADALTKGELARAEIAALHLRLPPFEAGI